MTYTKKYLKINVGSGGSGYTRAPVVTIDSPSESWGIDASAIAEIDSSGQVSSITLFLVEEDLVQFLHNISGPDVGMMLLLELLRLFQSIIWLRVQQKYLESLQLIRQLMLLIIQILEI